VGRSCGAEFLIGGRSVKTETDRSQFERGTTIKAFENFEVGDTPSHLNHALQYLSISPSPRTSMSAVPSTSQSNFVSIFNAALENYKRKTKKDLASHPLLPALQSCDSPEAILAVLRDQIPAFSQSQNGDDGLTKWITPTVNVLYSFSATNGGGVGLVNIRT
jgi:hypothetical protein